MILYTKNISELEIIKPVSAIPQMGIAEKILREIGIKNLPHNLSKNEIVRKIAHLDHYCIEKPVNQENIKKCRTVAKKHLVLHAVSTVLSVTAVVFNIAMIPYTAFASFALAICGVITLANITAVLLNTEHLLRMDRLLGINRPQS